VVDEGSLTRRGVREAQKKDGKGDYRAVGGRKDRNCVFPNRIPYGKDREGG